MVPYYRSAHMLNRWLRQLRKQLFGTVDPAPATTRLRRKSRRHTILDLECMEERLAPAVVAPLAVVVNTLSDRNTGGSMISLREALTMADSAAAQGLPAVITFSVSGTITLQEGALQLTAGTGTVYIDGGSAITLNANSASSVFLISAGANANLTGLTIESGSSGQGGGIANSGSLTINDCTIQDNQASNGSNTSGGEGGGVYNANTGTLTISNSIG